jgi:hypothetical protein
MGATGVCAALSPFLGCATSEVVGGKTSEGVALTGSRLSKPLQMQSPVARSLKDSTFSQFSGDFEPEHKHKILWDKAGFLAQAKDHGKLPSFENAEETPLVIIGGGMSGLLTAYLLRDLKPIILEQADRFGGNSKGESWRGIDYSIGAAYFMDHAPGSPLRQLCQELGLYDLCRKKVEDDPVLLNQRFYKNFWSGTTDVAHSNDFKKLGDHFAATYAGRDGLKIPEIPTRDPVMRAYVDTLDGENFYDYCCKITGGRLHPHVATLLEHYCWSTLGAGMMSLSAAIALNAIVLEFGDCWVAPGGNARIAEHIFEKVADVVPERQLRTRSLVIDVCVQADGFTHVVYEDAEGNLKRIKARSCVMACPKFVVGKILTGIEADRKTAISELRYNPYLVANILLKKSVSADFYDLYLLKAGHVELTNPSATSDSDRTTDLVLATYAHPRDDITILTLYRALPKSAGRAELYAPESFSRFTEEFKEEINLEILPALGLASGDVHEIRIARWGHALPIGAPGLIRKNIVDTASRPHKRQVFFVEQDNWMLAAFETCAAEALYWAPHVRASLKLP